MGTTITALDPSFESVLDVFENNFTSYDDTDAELFVTHRGTTVVGLRSDDRPPGAVQVVRSVSKAVVAILAWVLHDRGEIDINSPLSATWSEMMGTDLESVTLRSVLSHTSGLANIDESLDVHDILDRNGRAAGLVPQARPVWEPGTANGYHDLSFGVIVAGVIEKATGDSLSQLIDLHLVQPLRLDLWLGVPRHVLPRVRSLLRDRSEGPRRLMPSGQAELRPGPDLLPIEHTVEYLTASVPSANIVADARSLCALFAAFVSRGADRLVSEATLADATRIQSEGEDKMVGWMRRYASGFMLPDPTRPMGGEGRGTFGHYGQGGALVFGHPEAELAFAYLSRRDRSYLGADPRTADLAEVVLDCAGVHS